MIKSSLDYRYNNHLERSVKKKEKARFNGNDRDRSEPLDLAGRYPSPLLRKIGASGAASAPVLVH
jgi:hypothetical protein